jgi:acyl-CoA thioesterase-1
VAPSVAGLSSLRFYKGDPNLPNVLIIGDSISIGYTPEVRNLLNKVVNIYRVPDNAENTTHTLENLDAWLSDKKWAVIHCNWGLHDLTSKGPDVSGYGTNLKTLIDRLRATGAVVVFATTTPISQDNLGRLPGSELPYNAKALEVMKANKVLVNDLYNYALPILNTIQRPANVHYSSYGYAMLAQPVARAILAAIRGEAFDDYLELK